MANKVAKMEWKVTEEVKLAPELEKTTTDLSEAEKAEIKEQALKRMDEIDPMLRHTMDVKVVRNQRRNFINIRVRPDYATLLFQHKGGYGVRYCFFISDKLEPYIIITAVSPVEGKLQRLAKSQVEELEEGVKRFKEQYGISGESYHYTKVGERMETEQFFATGGVSASSKAHSSHFHLKMRIATEMYKAKFPILQIIDFDTMRCSVDHVRYNYSRENQQWEQVKPEMLEDAI